MSNLIHHLVAFPAKWLEAKELYREYNDKKDEELRLKFNEDKEIMFAWNSGGTHRGSFLDKQKLIDTIKEDGDPYGICECYYEYLLIETHYLDCIDGCLWGSKDYSHETWFRLVKVDEDTLEYQEIERPECLAGTVGFV
jgi:hypothetical protein